MRDPTQVLENVAKCSFILRMVKRLGLPPRPQELAKRDMADFKRDVLWLLKRMPGGNTDANRKKLFRAVNAIIRDWEHDPKALHWKGVKKKK